jgi:aquaporin Z
MSATPTQRYVAEFVGTFGLLLSVTGAALLSLNVDSGLYSADARVLLISFALGLGVLGMAYAFGDVSGGHFNPAITIGMWVAGRTNTKDVVPYILAQVLGGVVAVGVVAGVAYGNSALWASAQSAALASQGYSGNGAPYVVGLGSVFLLEVVLTMFLVLVALRSTASESFAKNLAPVGIALTLVMTNLVAIPIDGASINPARSFAPAVLSAMWSGDHWAIQQDWLFWVAPILGGLIAAGIDRLYRSR